jgi:hypothetical protein
VPFAYYGRLSPRGQAIYRRSDAVSEVALPQAELLFPFVAALRQALAADERPAVERAAGFLCRGITEMLRVVPVQVRVLALRPSSRSGELHGLYTYGEGQPPRIRVWMRTAAKGQLVAFRTFLRTLLHEVLHHLDYHHLKLGDSYHTEGFFRRESSLFRQIAPEEALRPARGTAGPTSARTGGPASTRRSGR